MPVLFKKGRDDAIRKIFWALTVMALGFIVSFSFLKVFEAARYFSASNRPYYNADFTAKALESGRQLSNSAREIKLDAALAESLENSAEPNGNIPISAEAYLALDLKSGNIVAAKNLERQFPIASLTKLVSALIAIKNIDENQPIIVSQDALLAYGRNGNLKEGEEIALKEILYPLLLESSNDAAEAIAEHIGRNNFINLMNREMAEIGASQTSFADPSGLSGLNISSAKDLAIISKYIYDNYSGILEITAQKTYRTDGHVWNNTNPLITIDSYIGGKIGYTDEALKTALSLFRFKNKFGSTRVILVILLKSAKRESDILSLLNLANK